MKTIAQREARPAGALFPTPGLLRQQRDRERALQRLRKLRSKAAEEIDRLIAFLDASDSYVIAELEQDGEEGDASYPEGGARLLSNPNEDDEDGADDEPSLGSHEIREAGAVSYLPSCSAGHLDVELQCEDEGAVA